MGRSRSRSYSRSRSRSGSLSSTSSGRAAKAGDWNGEGGYRLHLSDLATGVNRHEIEKLFRPYGPLNEVWVGTNPPCIAFINFRHRTDGERALKELDGKVVGGSRIGLSWARPRNYGGRPFHALRYRSPSPSHRRGYDRYNRRRYSRSRSRSSGYRRSGGKYRRRSSSSSSRSPSPRDYRREKRSKLSGRDDERRRRRRHRSESTSNSDAHSNASPSRKNGKRISRSASNEHHQVISSSSVNHHVDIEVHGRD